MGDEPALDRPTVEALAAAWDAGGKPHGLVARSRVSDWLRAQGVMVSADRPTGRWLCPGPGDRPGMACVRPLPCATHNVADETIGLAVYGSYFIEYPTDGPVT